MKRFVYILVVLGLVSVSTVAAGSPALGALADHDHVVVDPADAEPQVVEGGESCSDAVHEALLAPFGSMDGGPCVCAIVGEILGCAYSCGSGGCMIQCGG